MSLQDNTGIDICYLSQSHVYHWWRIYFQERFQRDQKDEQLSTRLWLQEKKLDVLFSVQGSQLYPSSIAFLTPFHRMPEVSLSRVRDIFVDATYKTNKQKYDLYCLLADVAGIGVPISYLLIRPATVQPLQGQAALLTVYSSAGGEQSESAIKTWLNKERGKYKDYVAKNMSKKSEPSRSRARLARQAQLQLQQLQSIALEAEALMEEGNMQEVDETNSVCSSQVCQASSADEMDNNAQQLQQGDELFETGTFSNLSDHLGFLNDPFYRPLTSIGKTGGSANYTDSLITRLVDMFRKHYSRHMAVPTLAIDGSVIYETQLEIHAACVREMATAVRTYPKFFQYLWQNWYRPRRWELWAQSAYKEVSLYRTTMKLETHWKTLKRDYMVEFNQPRLDLLVFIIINDYCPHQQIKLRQVAHGTCDPPWLKLFHKQWAAAQAEVDQPSFASENIHKYGTDARRWVCACPAYWHSPHWICKHLVHLAGQSRWSFPRWHLTENPLRWTEPPFVRLTCPAPQGTAAAVHADENESGWLIESDGLVESEDYERVAGVEEELQQQIQDIISEARQTLDILSADATSQRGRQLQVLLTASQSLQSTAA
ncbi:MAG: hypothetical protein M1813_005908 [Trichoglossum hirsutum]|nr:MAG: hypothetical protein M1813_005908 [Trichoglossum hirsutum]